MEILYRSKSEEKKEKKMRKLLLKETDSELRCVADDCV